MFDITQHLNNVVLPVGEHHKLSISQYSADLWCTVALYDVRTSSRVDLPRLYKHSEAVAYTTDCFCYVKIDDLSEIVNAAQEYVKESK
tara:strand:- start:448 stop:711 length:264 start_codon:yes stop_codon:yes gene_type:complete